MRLPSMPSGPLTDHVNSTYFHRTWNSPNDNGRMNMVLGKANARIQTGTVPVGLSVVGLPTTGAVYGVYRADATPITNRLNIAPEMWYTDTEVQDTFGVNLLLYTTGGRRCPPGSVYIYYNEVRKLILFAVSSVYLKACTGNIYPDLNLTIYKDTSRNTPVISQLFRISGTVTPTVVTTAITAMLTATPLGTIVSVNGWYYDPTQVPTLVNGDVISIVSDPDIVGHVDITVDDNQTGYYSTLYDGYREILHIPKALNPTNILITTDTLTTLVFDTVTHRGVLGNRLDEHALEPITHNDFSMGRDSLDAFAQILGASNISVRLYVRFADDKTKLGDDAYHLHDFYSLSDELILQQLLGLASPQLPEWRASVLETSPFLTLMTDFDGITATSLIPTYTQTMGYYDVAAVLGQQIRRYTYTGARALIRKPTRLFGYACNAIVYCNGRKLVENTVGLTNHNDTSFYLGFTLAAGVVPGDKIVVYICEAGYRTPVPFNPTSVTPGIVLDNEDYTLVEIVSYTTPLAVWKGTVTKGYREIPYSTADYTLFPNSDGTYTYQARSKHYDKAFYLIPKYGMVCASYDLEIPVENKSPIAFSLTTIDIDENTVPLMAYDGHEVYCNGYRLTPNLDYAIESLKGPVGDILQQLFVLSNYDHLNLEEGGTNTLEVVVHGDQLASHDAGYLIESNFQRSALPMLYSPSSSRAYVGGLLQNTLTESGNTVIFPEATENGAPVLMEFHVAFGAGKLLRDMSPQSDINLQGRLEHVLGLVPVEYPDIVLVNHLLALYSPFLAQITMDVGTDVFTIVDEAKDDRFLMQFAPYKKLLEADPVVGDNNPLIDRRFVTLAAHYANFTVQDPEQMIRLQRLIALVLTPSELSIKEVLL